MATQRRRVSVPVKIGNVWMGGEHPIVVQSMTNTDTADVMSTVNQVMALAQAGSELVRVTVNTEAAAQAVPKIVYTLDKFGVRVPVIGDFHYNGHLLLKKYPDMARMFLEEGKPLPLPNADVTAPDADLIEFVPLSVEAGVPRS